MMKEEKTMVFAVSKKTKIARGKEAHSFTDLKKGMHVSIKYKKDGDKNVAVIIKVAATNAQPQKAEEKTAESEKK